MADIPIAVAGNIATSVQSKVTTAGRIASFRLASNVRRFDRTRGVWYDAETNYFTVTCWRQLADNVLGSVSKGQPVVVAGRVHVRQWKNGEREGITVEIEANAVGHDLSRGTSTFHRKEAELQEPVVDGSQVEELHRMVEAEADGGMPADGSADLIERTASGAMTAGSSSAAPVAGPGSPSAAASQPDTPAVGPATARSGPVAGDGLADQALADAGSVGSGGGGRSGRAAINGETQTGAGGSSGQKAGAARAG